MPATPTAPRGPIVLPRRFGPLLDLLALACVFGALIAAASLARETLAPLSAPEATGIHLDARHLPGYALRTTLRMFVALFFSLLFTFLYAPWAAKSRRAAMVLVPILDVLQSVPILGFLSFTVVFFLNLFPGRVLGAECAAIFAIFTSQAWNMAFSLYQSLVTVPADLDEAATSFHLTPWQRFWRLEIPFAMPGLIWNTMLSMSGGWFFVVASEAISVGSTTVKLPGIGSYVALALERRDLAAVGGAILAMAVVILLYDQLLFRPLVAWSGKFRLETTASAEEDDPWMLALVRRAPLLRLAMRRSSDGVRWITGRKLARPPRAAMPRVPAMWKDVLFYLLLTLAGAFIAWRAGRYLAATLRPADVGQALLLGCFTLAPVIALMILASLVWVPVGVWIGLRPAWARRAQPLAQFMAAFPANLFFPLFVAGIARTGIAPDLGLTPLMMLGAQWYILFNVIAGAQAFPGDLREASAHFGLRGWLWWRRAILPGVFPYFVTGAVTAAGGCWNAAIVAEVASWGRTRLAAHGLGAYIAEATDAGSTPRIVLGVCVMSAFVLASNKLVWQRLYRLGARRLAM